MLWSVFTCIEFSCRLRYRVLFDILSGTSSKFRLVQITRLAWLEQLHGVGQVEAAPTASWPGRMSRNSSWTNKRRRGEGLGRLVTVVMRMATGSWPFLYSKEDDRQFPMSLECCLFNYCSFLLQRMSFFSGNIGSPWLVACFVLVYFFIRIQLHKLCHLCLNRSYNVTGRFVMKTCFTAKEKQRRKPCSVTLTESNISGLHNN